MSACRCRGRSGEGKRLFTSRQSAVSVAIRRGWVPNTYRCPSGKGWHLTHG